MLGLLKYATNNIGDDFQSYIMRSLLPDDAEVCYIDRDSPQMHHVEPVRLLVNAFLTPNFFTFGQTIHPEVLAAWIGPKVLNDSECLSVLRNLGPIGCRDVDSLHRCSQSGLNCYFSGCPTILCEQMPGIDVVSGLTVVVDVNPQLFFTDSALCVRQTTISSPFIWHTNNVDFKLGFQERIQKCHERHELLSMAEMVITSRIHIALPALGLGKAVIFVEDDISVPGRLTALPPAVRRYSKRDCSRVSLNPDDHRYDVGNYKENVFSCLRSRLGIDLQL